MWFFQWLKLAVDMQGQSLSFTKSNWVTGSQNKQVRKPTTKSFKINVGGIGLSAINLNELKRLPKIMKSLLSFVMGKKRPPKGASC